MRLIVLNLILAWIISFSVDCKDQEGDVTEVDELIRYSDGYAKQGNLEKALILANRAITLEPKNEKAKIQLSKVYATIASNFVDKFDCDSAKKYATKALELFKDNDGAYNDLSLCAMAEKKFNECIKYANEHLRLDSIYGSNSNAPYNNLAVCYREMKEYGLATENFLESLKRDPPERMGMKNIFSLGKIYFIQGNREGAKKYLEEFIKKYDNVSRWELRREFEIQYKESKKLLEVVNSGAKIGYPKGKEPAFNTDFVGILEGRSSSSKK
ncbi:tetratricopeptide repeat protein [Leptospira neocaledonica]|uniref:Uncharacterized protein n=1 Tax=Leptospira neocaledonica TaxID=2023192 RepID=A0A2N0A2J3_9LEPT|nr:tetratricopeptide repeat protein [Leptospira neocaledonica]PJZ78546.1 hypothetical protein CH365_04375 [Leptospira neocaledonica]